MMLNQAVLVEIFIIPRILTGMVVFVAFTHDVHATCERLDVLVFERTEVVVVVVIKVVEVVGTTDKVVEEEELVVEVGGPVTHVDIVE